PPDGPSSCFTGNNLSPMMQLSHRTPLWDTPPYTDSSTSRRPHLRRLLRPTGSFPRAISRSLISPAELVCRSSSSCRPSRARVLAPDSTRAYSSTTLPTPWPWSSLLRTPMRLSMTCETFRTSLI
ncbi:hypothetical protein BN1708_019562, partial [Verticillium longisporum]